MNALYAIYFRKKDALKIRQKREAFEKKLLLFL